MLIAIAAASVFIWFYSNHRLFWVLAWPGTVVHEFMHWVVGFVTLANPTNFSVFPEPPTAEGQCLGSVEFSNIGWWNALPVAIAPIIALPFAIGIAANMQFTFSWWGWFTAWLLASVIGQSMPSTADWSIAFKYKAGIAFYAGVVYLLIR